MANNQILDQLFLALSDPTRRSVLEQLSRQPMQVKEMKQNYPISAPAFTKHLNVLESAGIIARQSVGRTVECRLKPGGLDLATQWLYFYSQYWTKRLDALEAILAKNEDEI